MPAKGTWIKQVEKRARNGKTRVDSADPRHFCFDATIGSIHYKDNPKDEAEQWKEIDNVFEPAPAPWNWQMLKAGYHIRVKEDFIAGQIIEFEKQGETVQFQPMALEWTNDLDQIQPISMPHEIAPIITNPEVDLLPAVGMPSHQGTIRWNDAYGDGLDFEWRCTSTRLVKILEIESLNKLPTPEQYVLDGGNPVLRLNLIFDPSKDVGIYVDGTKWNKASKKQTFNVIEFRKDGEVLWGFMPLRYWGSGEGEENEGQSVATLEKRGNKLYISIRVPYSWLQSVVYPMFIDTPVDEQIDDGNEDASEKDNDTEFTSTNTLVQITSHGAPLGRYNGGFYWDTVNIPQGATITVAYISVYIYNENWDDASCEIYGNDVDSANNFEVEADVTSRIITTNHTPWIQDGLGVDWKNSPSLVDVVKEIVDRTSWATNNNMCIIAKGRDDIQKSLVVYAYDGDSALGAKLHIEYTAEAPPAAGGGSMAAKLIGAGLL